MADYYVITLSLASLDRIKRLPEFGSIVQNAIEDNAQQITRFPSLTDVFGNKNQETPPSPIPLLSKNESIGEIIGRFYDGTAVGIDSQPALIPAQSVACLVSTSVLDEVSQTPGIQVFADIRGFQQSGRTFERGQSKIVPVFINDRDVVFPLHIVKDVPFPPENSSKIDRLGDGKAWKISKDYSCPHAASLIMG